MILRAAVLLSLVGALAAAALCNAPAAYEPKDGDIVFQTSLSPQSEAVRLATRSPCSHMGIVHLRGGKAFVYEALEPVTSTPLDAWIARGQDGRFVAKRLRRADALLTPAALGRMRAVATQFLGKPYDLDFAWSDERLYCSELVWKLYQRALGLEVGRLERLRDFDLSAPVVQAQLRERWKDSPPLDETVISPAAIFASELLRTVYEN